MKIEPTEEMIEAGAHAAWKEYTGRNDSDEWNKDTWPETNLYPNANEFRKCAKVCFIEMMKVYNGKDIAAAIVSST